ncbi:hypothetical protein K7X08_027864 [Anisodus acutangulus]|uniref:Uncharacterized protein n=1 Tax=Anisodus acutangulus TaxID=402998 RepID=A0A9Q1MUD6_9SOLA|nr:hypothetical protein K7X08_027864 [Anisodus acutangulus]
MSGGAAPENVRIGAAIARAFSLFVAISVSSNISGGHVNPAVTFGCFLGGHITLCRSVLYWIAQLLGSVVALSLLKFATSGSDTSSYALKAGATPWNAIIFEIVMTFGLVYTVYATTIDPKRGNMESIAPIVIGFLVGANVLSGGGCFYGAEMNPAMAFGQALDSWTWKSHWIYWLGPFVGAAIAALVYDTIFIGSHEQLSTEVVEKERDEEEADSSSLDKLLKKIDEFESEEEVANCGLGEEECLECEALEDEEDNSDRVSMPEKFKSITVEKLERLGLNSCLLEGVDFPARIVVR